MEGGEQEYQLPCWRDLWVTQERARPHLSSGICTSTEGNKSKVRKMRREDEGLRNEMKWVGWNWSHHSHLPPHSMGAAGAAVHPAQTFSGGELCAPYRPVVEREEPDLCRGARLIPRPTKVTVSCMLFGCPWFGLN